MAAAPRGGDREPNPDLSLAREVLERYRPRDEEQARFRERILAWIEAHPADAHLRSCLAGHLTASVLLLDAARERVLLHHHRKLDRWLQFGGHCDGDANLRGCAWRELVEESGVEPAQLGPDPVDLDIHRIPARPGEPEHDHLDVRYLALAPAGARPAVSDESHRLEWFAWEELEELPLDASLERLVAIGRAARNGSWTRHGARS